MAVGDRVGHDVVERVRSGLYLGGAWRAATGGGMLPVDDPGNGDLVAEIADATATQAPRKYFAVAAG